MTTDEKFRDEKLQSLGRTDKYEYFKDEEMLSSDQSKTIEQAKFTYSTLGKALEKQTKKIQDQSGKQ